MPTVVDHEKQESVAQLERLDTSASESKESRSEGYDDAINALTEQERKKLIRRIDVRLVLTLGFMYCVSLMDRTNLGIAVVAGMGVDLELGIGARYSIITLVFVSPLNETRAASRKHYNNGSVHQLRRLAAACDRCTA